MKSYLNKIPVIYIPLLMTAFISGSAVLDLFVITSAILWIFMYRNNFYKIPKTFKNIFIFLLVFYLLILISSFLSDYFSYSLSKSIVFIRFIFFGLFFYQIFTININYLSKYLKGILIVIIFLIIDTFIQLFFGRDIFGFESISKGRLSGPFGDELILGSFLFVFSSIYSLSVKIHDWKFFIYLLLCLAVITLTGERIALIKFIFFHTALLFFLFKQNKIKINLKQFMFLLSTLLIISSLFFKSNLMDRHIEFVNKFVPGSKNFILYSGHYSHFVSSMAIFKDKPITGTGFRSFRKDCKNYNNYFNFDNVYLIDSVNLTKSDKIKIIESLNRNICSTHPHNFYLEILSEIGILGFFSFMVLLIYVYRKLSHSDLKIFFLVYFFPFVSTSSIFHGKNTFLFVFIIILLSLINYQRNLTLNEKY